jgi:hypothetical protein
MTTSSDGGRLSGGLWDKLGNRYEALWTVDALLAVLRGDMVAVTVEPHGRDGEGVEFRSEFSDGSMEYLSAKRQTTSNIWSLAELTRPKERERSILGDLFNRLGEYPSKDRAVFCSATTPNKLLRLCEEAKRADSAKAFEIAICSAQDLHKEFEHYVLGRLKLNWVRAWNKLQRLRVNGCTEDLLRSQVERIIERDIVHPNGNSILPASARSVLYELVYESFGRPILRQDIVDHLATLQLAPRDWTRPTTDHETLERRNQLYMERVEAELIQGATIARKEVVKITETLVESINPVFLAGAAGMGKSCISAQCARALNDKGIPFLALRLDSQIGTSSTLAFGHDLGFSLSPVAVLSGVARGRPAVIIIDQLDALSTASGRNPLLWDLFREILLEIAHFGHIHPLLVCRAYDLDHDDGLRALVSKHVGALRVNVEPLDLEIVRKVLGSVGAPLDKFQPRHLELLRTPLHLSVFLQGEPSATTPAMDLTQLYDRYWDRKRRDARNRTPPARFEEVVQRLANELSERQSLSAPKDIFDAGSLTADAEMLASDHVFVLEGRLCRFFHETFFDYTFARGFVTSGKRLLRDLLPPEQEQHLFRRAQVRQVLSYQRGREGGFSQFLEDLNELLTADRIRFHLKKAVLDWMSHLSDPTIEEWNILAALLPDPHLGQFIKGVPWNKPAWFIPLRDSGSLSTWLCGEDETMVNFTIHLLALPETMKVHSASIATLIKSFFKNTPEWRKRFVALCSFCEFHHSREFFELFLEKFHEGWFDEETQNGWYGLSHLVDGNPDYAAEFLVVFLYRRFPGCLNQSDRLNQPHGPLTIGTHFLVELKKVEPIPVLRVLLPALAELSRRSIRNDSSGKIDDPLSIYTDLYEKPYSFGTALMQYLVHSMRHVACFAPAELNSLTLPLEKLSTESGAFVLENTWEANGAYFGDKAVDYIVAQPDRLDIQYRSISGGDSEAAVTRKLLEAIGTYCSNAALQKLESAILAYRDPWENKHPDRRGYTHYALLRSLPEQRLGRMAWHALDELRRKFGERTFGQPRPMRVYSVESPISYEKAVKMDDTNWLNAMRVYRTKTWQAESGFPWGGPGHLAGVLFQVARDDKPRFAKLALQMDGTLPAIYFEQLLRGLMEITEKKLESAGIRPGAMESLDFRELLSVIERLHSLPGRHCGRELCSAIERIADQPLPESVLKIVGWYAQNDPDPSAKAPRTGLENPGTAKKSDYRIEGMNSTRGAAADAIRNLLYAEGSRWDILKDSVHSLVQDPNLGVRCCTLGCLRARLRDNRDEAIELFNKLIVEADVLLNEDEMDHFLHFAAFSHYSYLRPLFRRMLASKEDGAREISARQITVAAFYHETAREDLHALVLSGDEVCRAAAAGVFAHNLGQAEVAAYCREHLTMLFYDESIKVRKQADDCWRRLTMDQLAKERQLIQVFVKSPALAEGIGSLLHALEDCPERLPEEVLSIPERLHEEQLKSEADRTNSLDYYFHGTAGLVMRLYQQSRSRRPSSASAALETRCLNLLDFMLSANRGSVDGELQKFDR